MAEVHRVGADAADQGYTQCQRGREEDADGRIFFQVAAAGKETDGKSHQNRCRQCTDKQIAADQIRHSNAGQNGMCEGVTEEGHGAQDNITANYGTDDAHQNGSQQTALHEGIGQGLEQGIKHGCAPRRARAGSIDRQQFQHSRPG